MEIFKKMHVAMTINNDDLVIITRSLTSQDFYAPFFSFSCNTMEKKNAYTVMLQFSSTRFARINLLTSEVRSWERRMSIQNSVRNERNLFLSLAFSLRLSSPLISIAFLLPLPPFFVAFPAVVSVFLESSTERKRDSNVDHWRLCARGRTFFTNLKPTRPRESPSLEWNTDARKKGSIYRT